MSRLIALVLMCLAGFVSVSKAADFPPDLQRIKDRGELLVAAYVNDIPPFFFTDDRGELAGIDVDIASKLAEVLGVRLRFLRIANRFDELPQILLERRADVVISAFSRSIKRAQTVRFTEPYVNLGRVLFLNRTGTVSILEGKSDFHALNRPDVAIGANEGGVYADLAREMFPAATIHLYKTHRVGTADLLNGTLHGYLCDQPCANAYNRPREWHKIKPPDDWGLKVRTLPLHVGTDPVAMAVHHDDSALHAFLNVYVAENRANGVFSAITAKYGLNEGQ